MPKAILRIENEVECKFVGLDVATRRKLVNELKFYLPYARHLPSVKLGRWDGSTSLASIGGSSYINLLDRLLPIVQDSGYEVEVDDRRPESPTFEFEPVNKNSYAHIVWPEGHPLAGQPILLKDHQIEVINSYLTNITGIRVTPTGAGKTIITSVLSHKIEKYGRSIVIVPTKDLVTQTEDDYVNMGLDVGVFFGDRKDYGKTHTICTWQSLESLYKKSKNDDIQLEVDINQFFDNVVCVICDETHRVKGDVLRKLLSGPLAYAPIRWGLTGTMPEGEFEQLSVISCIGPVIGKIDTKDLQDKGLLAKLNINVWQLKDLGESAFSNYQAELKWLTTNQARLTYLAKQIADQSNTGNCLVLVDRIETGKMLQSLILGSVFVSGEMKSKDRKEEYKEIQEVDGKVIIATFSVASTGINIVRIYNLFLFEAGQSFVKVIQSIGRGIRVAPDKDHVEVFDICSNCKYSKRHLSKRKKIYTEAQYPFKITKVEY